MLMQALNDKTGGKRGHISETRSLIAPTKGWWVGSPLAAAPAGTAYLLENAFPELDYVRARGGAQQFATGMPGKVTTLMPFTNGVTVKMFAYSGGNIYDVSLAGPVGAPLVTGLDPVAIMSYVQYSGTGPQTLICSNGVNPLQFYDGTAWATGAQVQANGTITFTLKPVDGETITLNGTVVTFKTAVVAVNQVLIGADLAATLQNLQFFLNNSNDAQIKKCTYSASATVLTIRFVAIGAGGNSFSIAASVATASGATLTGGVSPWTGLGSAVISYVWEYNHRLYGIAASSTDVWYPAVDAIGGAVTIFPMGPLLRYGGRLVAGGTWNQMTTNGTQHVWFVVSSEGEVILFVGSFPGDPATWKIAGSYKIGRPLGQNCIQPAGADVAILTEDGVVALSQVMTLDQIALANQAVTRNIGPAFRDAVLARVPLPGWQMLLWPLRSMAIINMPQIGTVNTQFVSNARTGAWCRYTGWDAQCFAVYGLDPSGLYFGTSDGRVMQAETGGQDDMKLYTATIFYSYTDLSGQDVSFGGIAPSSASQSVARKHVTMIRTRFQTNVALVPKITVNVEYDTTIPVAPSSSTALTSGGSSWGTAVWGVDTWGGGTVSHSEPWTPTYADASQLAPVVQVSLKTTATPDARLTSIDVLFETGSIFG